MVRHTATTIYILPLLLIASAMSTCCSCAVEVSVHKKDKMKMQKRLVNKFENLVILNCFVARVLGFCIKQGFVL